MAGFTMSLQIPVTVRQRIKSPLHTCGPSPPTAPYEGFVEASLISGQTFESGAAHSVWTLDVFGVSSRVIDQVEFDQLNPLQLQI